MVWILGKRFGRFRTPGALTIVFIFTKPSPRAPINGASFFGGAALAPLEKGNR